MLAQLPRGVVVVSGTNGKTTTTKMIVQLLQSQGLKVLTNRTGSNFIRGVLASLLTEVDWRGRVDADIAVLELDEAHAVRFIQHVRPQATLLLNVMRDQLDRFGEVDYTASLLHQVAQATTGVVVINQDDPRLVSPTSLTRSRPAPPPSASAPRCARSSCPTTSSTPRARASRPPRDRVRPSQGR